MKLNMAEFVVFWILLISALSLEVTSQMMSVVGKSTCSGFKTGLYMSCYGGNTVRYIQQRVYFMKTARIYGYFDTKYMIVLRIEQILHNSEDQKFGNFFNLEQVDFCVTLVKCKHTFDKKLKSCSSDF